MISTYDDEIDTITQIMIDWFTNRIRQLDEFNQDQIYQSTLMIDEKTPLPCIGFIKITTQSALKFKTGDNVTEHICQEMPA